MVGSMFQDEGAVGGDDWWNVGGVNKWTGHQGWNKKNVELRVSDETNYGAFLMLCERLGRRIIMNL